MWVDLPFYSTGLVRSEDENSSTNSRRSVATNSGRKVTADDGEIMGIKNKKATRSDTSTFTALVISTTKKFNV